ncbi:MAG: Cys-tRNA(Pro) deacylase [Clostridiales bacterium]|jgi:Cys-tRNA(Pro)/Cys-tRNA(Cys) deacylase|nr:Cys-tRNA(Pro) deacylase [Clostridiales bacterium]
MANTNANTNVKTNALRILEAAGISFNAYEYDLSDGKIDGVSVAMKTGRDPDTVFKTLVTSGKDNGFYVFVIPVGRELDLKKAAAAAGEKYVEMIKSRDLEVLTGYVHGGCSPVGMKKALPTFIEETAQTLDCMMVSAGRVGLQAELAPGDLATVTDAKFKDLV